MTETKRPPRPFETSPIAVLARLSLIGSVAAIIYATAAPDHAVPTLFYSHNLEHFAAFYTAALLAAAALPRQHLRRLAFLLAVFAAALELTRLVASPSENIFEKWSADFGGVLAAYIPLVVARIFRRPTVEQREL